MTTIKEVAALAGVSTATVSRALNGLSSVNPELVERVREAAARVGYRPNTVARSLRTQSTTLIALIIADISDNFFTAVARGVEDVAQDAGYSVLLCNTDEDRDKELAYFSAAEQAQVAGIVLSPHDARSDVSTLQSANIPLVAIDRPLQVPVDSVIVRSYQGAFQATEHLLDQGWKRPGCISGPSYATTSRERVRGYKAALVAHGGIAAQVADGHFTQEGGAAAARLLLDNPEPPDSLFVANAQMALGALDEIALRGMRVGYDIGVITYDDEAWMPHVEPPLSAVAQPAYEVGRRATDLLLHRINADAMDGEIHQVLLSPKVIVRLSSLRLGDAQPPLRTRSNADIAPRDVAQANPKARRRRSRA